MTHEHISVRVHYPVGTDRLILRTDADWDRDLEPTSRTSDGRLTSFDVKTSEPFVYYKPMLVDESGERWSCGPNRLATSGATRPFDIFPFFRPSGAHLTELESLEHGGRAWGVRVCLPPGYEENTLHRYPVLYMNDGHNLFLREESATGENWNVPETLSELDEMTSVEQVIIVGVYTRDRMVDYGRSGGESYRDFLVKCLVPVIDARYRTLSGPDHRAIMGSSLGGVSALECAWRLPHTFGMAAALSASFGYDDDVRHLVLEPPRAPIRVYLDSGWPRDNFEVTRDVRARLLAAGFTEGKDLLYFAFPGDRHQESAWGDRVHIPFQFFFGERPDERSLAADHRLD